MTRPQQLGHIVLRVRDIERSEKFYTKTLDLKVTAKIAGRMVFLSASDEASHELALIPVGPDAPGPEQSRVGLYHFAWQMDTLESLQKLYTELKEQGIKIGGVGDHGISLGIYFFDPDGNEIEVFYELPKNQWPETDIFAGHFPGSIEAETSAVNV